MERKKFRVIIRVLFYLLMILTFSIWLESKGWLLFAIGFLSVLYLIFYFIVGTFVVFLASIEELGSSFQANDLRSTLLAILILAPLLLILWGFMLVFWPIFLIPDRSFSSKEKYDAIHNFEVAITKKYSSHKIN